LEYIWKLVCENLMAVGAGPLGAEGPENPPRKRNNYMDIQIATLCDFAVDYNGKMVISGTFDALAAKALPVVHPQCALAMRICMTPEDSGDHKLGINIIDADGNSLDPAKMPIKADMPVKVPDNVAFVTRNLVLNFQGLTFKTAGVYSVDISLDDELVMRLPLRIVQVQKSDPAAA
jgi:hypothetical protein